MPVDFHHHLFQFGDMARSVVILTVFMLSLSFSAAQTHKLWLDISGGPTFTDESLTILAPGLGVTLLTKQGPAYKIKGSYHGVIAILSDPTWSADAALMIGGLEREKKRTMEGYIGVGYIKGVRTGKYYPGGGWFSLGSYEMVPFQTAGLSLEGRIQWRVLGVGFDANINDQMSYAGLKYFVRIGLVKTSP